jgi:hypothetical protein
MTLYRVFALITAIGSPLTASAALIDRGNGLIYDNNLNITWLANANAGAGSAFDNGDSASDGKMTWDNALAWANQLIYGGYDDWRLPSAVTKGESVPCQYSCNGGELGHLYYDDLGLQSASTISLEIGRAHV